MATTQYGVNANEAVKLWSRDLWTETMKLTTMAPLMGSSKDSALVVKEELQKGAGDRVRVTLRMQLGGAGIEGDNTLEGNEEALVTHTDDLLINQLRHAVKSDGEMTEERIHFSIRNEAKDGLADWWADRIDTALINQLAGNTDQTDTKFTGHNATLAPTSATGNTRIIYGDSTDTTEASLSSGTDTMSLTYIDRLLNLAKIATPRIRPALIGGQRLYCLLVHPNVTRTLETTNAANIISVFDLQRAEMEGGKKNSPLLKLMGDSGFQFQYKNVLIKEDSRVPLAPGTTAVYRNVFFGAGAAMVGFGRRYGNRRMSWKEKLFDYDNQLGVKAGMIWGCKKAQFNSIDNAVIVQSTFAAAP